MSSIGNIEDYFGCDVFCEATMKERLEGGVFQTWKDCIQTGRALPQEAADKIAEAMKNWALEKGATHYSHWFQPMTGITAEKHEAFIKPIGEGKVMMEFSGKELIKGEPDASSFPSGGLREAFEARGYTAWDPTAFAFVKDRSLYIPSCFFSYTGEVLDKKTPLMRSIEAVSQAAVRVLRLMGDEATQRVRVCVGAEQEYFLIPRDLYNQREDLRLTGRTLFGAAPAKGQELGDHYFGTIRTRVTKFMQDLDSQLWRLGVLSKTKHNEGAPCQHELAPIYSEAGHACDSNQLIMEIMKKCAAKHDLVCLLHEKPFAGISGSGKHNNWSLCTDTGRNLFQPGKTPIDNGQFLVFLAAFIAGVDEYQDLLRCSTAYAANDHRLGSHEAPASIISIYLGDELTAVVDSIIYKKDYHEPEKPLMQIGVDGMPAFSKDTSDRNRTSPLAFTGNKFEFRMLGASQSVADPNIALNAIMAEQLNRFAEKLETADDRSAAVHQLICDAFTQHQKIIWSGNCYAEEWKEEALRRGLSNLDDTATAMARYMDEKNVELMERLGIYTREEYTARFEIQLDSYCKTVKTEAKTMVDMAMRQILPAAAAYGTDLAKGVRHKKEVGAVPAGETELVKNICNGCNDLYKSCCLMSQSLTLVPEEKPAALSYYAGVILPQMGELRQAADSLEQLTAKSHWPYPTYSDILFY